MAELRIPPEYERGFLEIRDLDYDQVHELVSALEGEETTLSRTDLRQRVGQKVSTILRDELDRVMETLFSLYALRDDMGVSVPDLADGICEAMEDSEAQDLHFSDDEDREHFKAKLIDLLGVQSLDISARATDLLYEHEHTIHGTARVLTDVRPVFGANPEDPPSGAVITHTLKINYHEGREIKEFFVALDTGQLDDLLGVLGRASLKAESLKKFLGTTDVSYIDAE